MGKRIKVVLPDREERRTVRGARSRKPATGLETELRAVRKAAEYSFPTADMVQMLHEMDRSYRD
jgi:hypothetical protein